MKYSEGIYICVYAFTQLLRTSSLRHKVSFISGVEHVWIQRFSFFWVRCYTKIRYSQPLHWFINLRTVFAHLLGWLVGLYGISTFIGYLTPNRFYAYRPFYVKQFSLAWVHSLIVKNISISSYSFCLNSSNLKNSVQYKYRFCLHTVKCQNSSILYNSVYRKYSSISNNSV